MFKHLYLLVLVLLVGCMEQPSVPVKPPSPPVAPAQPDAGEFAMALEADANTISTIFKYTGPSNAITIRDKLSMAFDGTAIDLPAGSNVMYSMSELGGTFTFGRPKPVVTTRVGPLTVHPILDKIVLRQPNIATAFATDAFGIQHTHEFTLPDVGTVLPEQPGEVPEPEFGTDHSAPSEAPCPEQSVAEPISEVVAARQADPEPVQLVPTPDPASLQKRSVQRPKLFLWTLDWHRKDHRVCTYCDQAKRELAGTDFDVIVDPKDLQPFSPSRPCFQWSGGGRTHKQLGWQGLKPFLAKWESSQKASPLTLDDMAKYNGPVVGVNGMTVLFHLTHHHGFSPEELAGYSEDQLKRIHSAVHRDDHD